MHIEINKDNDKMTLAVLGRVDTVTSPELEKALTDNIDGVKELTLDFKDMPYTSSAGLRVILKAQKIMNEKGSMKIINVSKEVMEIFEITGFSDILNIE